MKESYDFLINTKDLLKDDDYVIVAVSGGPDSMALLHLLQEVRKKIKIRIVCVHINHNVRKESESEKDFVYDYCKQNNIIFEYMKIENYTNENFQKQARDIRYNFFSQIVNKYNSKYLFTAHHADDLIESILMRIVRGSSLKGYAGFSKISDYNGYKIVRPLIFYTKEEILNYDKENNISYVLDKSNEKDDYTRNRYRHKILPFLKKEDKNVHKKFLSFSEMIYEYDSFFEKYISKIDVYKDNILDIKVFLNEDKIIQKRIVENILKDLYKDNISSISSKHVGLIIDLIYDSKPNISLKLPLGMEVKKEYDKMSFISKSNINYDYDILLENITLLPNGRSLFIKDNEDDDSNYVCRISSKEVLFPLHVRNRKKGDRISVKNLDGRKKVKDVFIDEKIPVSKRDLWPVVVDSNNEIIWIPGVKKSKYSKEKYEKYDIIIKYC